MGETGTSSTRTLQLEVTSIAKSICKKKGVTKKKVTFKERARFGLERDLCMSDIILLCLFVVFILGTMGVISIVY